MKNNIFYCDDEKKKQPYVVIFSSYWLLQKVLIFILEKQIACNTLFKTCTILCPKAL